VQGEKTESQYFDGLKQERDWNKKVSVTVLALPESPDKMAKSGERFLEDYDYVFIVTDFDQFTENQFDRARRTAGKKKNKKSNQPRLFIVISYPKFDLWLCAHFKDMRSGCDDRKVTEVEKKLGILQSAPQSANKQSRKHMPDDFPYGDVDKASRNVNIPSYGYWDEQGSTNIPSMIKMIDSLNS